MSSIKLSPNASGTGEFTISAPNSNTNRTLTLPDATGTILTTATAGVPVNGPAFSAYMSATQSISNVTVTKITFNTKNFDTNSNFDTSNYRFTPTVSGYYQFSLRIASPASSSGISYIYIAKNGDINLGLNSALTNNSAGLVVSTSGLLYMNGTTDYVEAFAYQSTGGTATVGSTSSGFANFQGAMVRAG